MGYPAADNGILRKAVRTTRYLITFPTKAAVSKKNFRKNGAEIMIILSRHSGALY